MTTQHTITALNKLKNIINEQDKLTMAKRLQDNAEMFNNALDNSIIDLKALVKNGGVKNVIANAKAGQQIDIFMSTEFSNPKS